MFLLHSNYIVKVSEILAREYRGLEWHHSSYLPRHCSRAIEVSSKLCLFSVRLLYYWIVNYLKFFYHNSTIDSNQISDVLSYLLPQDGPYGGSSYTDYDGNSRRRWVTHSTRIYGIWAELSPGLEFAIETTNLLCLIYSNFQYVIVCLFNMIILGWNFHCVW